jgi:hypothetical protein
MGLMAKKAAPKKIQEAVIVMFSLWIALPLALAVFPQKGSIRPRDCEPHFHDLKTLEGKDIEMLYYNKGL